MENSLIVALLYQVNKTCYRGGLLEFDLKAIAYKGKNNVLTDHWSKLTMEEEPVPICLSG